MRTKDHLYIFDDNNRFIRVLVGPSDEEKKKYTNSILNPSINHLRKFPMSHYVKEGNIVVVHDKEGSDTKKAIREKKEESASLLVEAKFKEIIAIVKEQDKQLDIVKKENKELEKRFNFKKVAAISLVLNIICIAATLYAVNI